MKKIYYLLCTLTIVSSILLLSDKTVKAASSNVTVTIPVTGAGSLTVQTLTYTGVMPLSVEVDQTAQQSILYHVGYEISNNAYMLGQSSTKYYNGWANVQIVLNPSGQNGSYTVTSNEFNGLDSEGIRVGLYQYSNTQLRFFIFFDNYHSSNGVNLAELTSKIAGTVLNPNDAGCPINVSVSISLSASNVEASDGVINNRLTALIYSAVSQATVLEFTDILTALTALRTQDYTYYTQIVTQLQNLNTAQDLANTRLLSILNEIDIDFQQVQTVLDLFPSYRTAVLQYWQDLLQMNAAQSSEAAAVESAYAENNNTSETLLSGMDGLQFPTVSAQNFNILSNVDNTQKTNFFGLIGTITNNGFITTMLLIIVTGAIVGFILYGKK